MRRKAGEIYGAIVAQARRPVFYAELGVPDTPSGRYEMVVVHLFLVLERLRSDPGAGAACRACWSRPSSPIWTIRCARWVPAISTVPKKVRRAATGLYERSMAYKAALEAGDADALAAAFTEHVYVGADAIAGLGSPLTCGQLRRAGGNRREAVAIGASLFRPCRMPAAEALMSEPLAWSYRTAEIPEAGLRQRRAATEAERARLRALELVVLRAADRRVRHPRHRPGPLSPRRHGGGALTQTASSRSSRAQTVEGAFDVEFWPPASCRRAERTSRGVERRRDRADRARPDRRRPHRLRDAGGRLDPYPRKAGCGICGRRGSAVPPAGRERPFAALKKIKDRG